jgi:PiT family inorganic phosphate transporter
MAVSAIAFVVFIIAVALVFDFTNGMHDAANSVATIVSTRVLTPRQAVAWAAFFNFISFLVFGTAVASMIGKGLVKLQFVTVEVIFAALVGAILWNLITWYFGFPSSSSHALIGGYAGAAIANAGFGAIIPGGWILTLLFIVLAPVIGLALGFLFYFCAIWLIHFFKPSAGTVTSRSRRLQLFSAAAYSLAHGSNDAQKTMGIITALLVSAKLINTFAIPLWVVLAAQAAIGLGTLSGGWRIVKTMGQKIVKLRPIDGVCAETASAISIFFATWLGMPVSTTHVITGAISGVGAAKRTSSVRWHITFKMVWVWIFTIPGAAALAALFFLIVMHL